MGDKGYLHPFWDGRCFENGVGEHIRTIVELKMHRLSYYIRSLPEWWSCLHDADVQTRWRELALSEDYLPEVETHVGDDVVDLRMVPPLTEYQIQWVLEELHYYAQRRDSNGCQPSCFERIFESDILQRVLLEDLSMEITKCFLSDDITRHSYTRPVLAGVMEHKTTMLDFIHPFSFPIISGRTLRFEQDEGGERYIVRAILGKELGAIPTDFQVSTNAEGGGVIRKGYINGIPPTPQFSSLLALITSTLGKTIPLFEHTLTSLHRSNASLMLPRIPLPKNPPLIQYLQRSGGGWKEEDPPDVPGQGIGEGTDDEEDEAMWEEWRVKHARWVEARRVIIPELPSGGCGEWMKGRRLNSGDTGSGETVHLAGRNVQVFVKLGRVELTPDNPRFEGGEWTSEGSFENRIVACASIVLDAQNVTEGWLDFRMAVTRPHLMTDDPDSAGMAYWGKKRGSHLNQHIGSVTMKEGRCITYPNIYQNRLSPFCIVDRSKPGHRTTLQFQLVDPEIAILSTTDVPPQPVSWATDALLDSIDKRLPNELVLKMVQFALDEQYFVRDEEAWPLRFAMQLDNQVERRKLAYYFKELL